MDESLLAHFVEKGFVVVPGVLSASEVQEARQGLRTMLLTYGCDVDGLEETGTSLGKLSSTNGSGGVLDAFYFPWKLRLNEHPSVVGSIQQLWRATYARPTSSQEGDLFAHPFGPFDASQGYMYIDRVCYRLPDQLSQALGKGPKAPLQRSLTPHLDCCPPNRFAGQKWRPIQAFVALTDTLHRDEGGFEVCPGMHVQFDDWARSRPASLKDGSPAPCVGQFTPIRPKEDADILQRMEHVPVRAGDLVCWDYRLAHANSLHNFSRPREAVYVGVLPAIALNRRYAETQLQLFLRGELPTDQWHNARSPQPCEYTFSELGRKLMTLDDW